MIVESLHIPLEELRRRTGWDLKPVGACKGDACVPLPTGTVVDGTADLRVVAERLGMPLVHDPEHEVWAVGPESRSGRALLTAEAPELVLPDFDGRRFALSSLLGRKVVLTAWASW